MKNEIGRLWFTIIHPMITYRHFRAVNAPWPELCDTPLVY